MNIVSSFFSGFEHISLAIIGFIMMMGVVVFVHEFGHFYVARLCGVKVIDFSLGFGKKIFSRTDKKGTVWSLSLLPFGGYVRFFGDKSFASDENITELDKLSEEEKKQAFYFKTIPQKMAIVLAGPLANFILSFIIILLLNFFVGTVSLKPIIHDFTPDSIASKNGIEKGDEFLFVNGNSVKTADDVRKEVIASFGQKIDFTIKRDTKILSLSFSPQMVVVDNTAPMPFIGVIFNSDEKNIIRSRYNILESTQKSYDDVIYVIKLTGKFLKKIIIGEASVKHLSGPLKIGDTAGVALKSGFESFLFLTAIISISIGFMNLLPIPVLDGGHFMFYLFELLGLKLSLNLREILFKAGFVLIIALMIFTVINDILTIGVR